MLVNVEIKNWHEDSHFDPSAKLVEPIIDELLSRGDDTDRWLISSFSFRTIEACRAYAPQIATAWLCAEVSASAIERTAGGGHTAIHPWEPALSAGNVDACHQAGLLVNAWTCNDPGRLAELAAMGVDGVCTDVPDVARQALGGDPAVTPRWPAVSR
jgi:glycerophosphoryl diester phosphodiesterase